MNREIIEISSLKDIVDKVPIECIDSFLIDLKSWIELTHKWNQLKKMFPWMIEHDDTTIQWVNDWKNEADIQIDFIATPSTDESN